MDAFFWGGGEGGIYPYMVTGGVAYLKTYDTILIIIILSAQSSSVETVNQGVTSVMDRQGFNQRLSGMNGWIWN